MQWAVRQRTSVPLLPAAAVTARRRGRTAPPVRANTSPKAISTSAAVQAAPLVMPCCDAEAAPAASAPPCEAQTANAKRKPMPSTQAPAATQPALISA